MVPGEKDARTCLYELRSQLQEYERLRSRAGKSDAARQEFERKQNSLLAFGKEAGSGVNPFSFSFFFSSLLLNGRAAFDRPYSAVVTGCTSVESPACR